MTFFALSKSACWKRFESLAWDCIHWDDLIKTRSPGSASSPAASRNLLFLPVCFAFILFAFFFESKLLTTKEYVQGISPFEKQFFRTGFVCFQDILLHFKPYFTHLRKATSGDAVAVRERLGGHLECAQRSYIAR